MANKPRDLSGQTFGRLLVLKDSGERGSKGGIIWDCLCDCGNRTKVERKHLLSGATISCGCYRKETSETRLRNFHSTVSSERRHEVEKFKGAVYSLLFNNENLTVKEAVIEAYEELFGKSLEEE